MDEMFTCVVFGGGEENGRENKNPATFLSAMGSTFR
jgi:hypothetical protein